MLLNSILGRWDMMKSKILVFQEFVTLRRELVSAVDVYLKENIIDDRK